MKIRITMKDPDGFSNSIGDEFGFGEERQKEKEAFESLASKWFMYQEYLTVEIDTETKTITVIERK